MQGILLTQHDGWLLGPIAKILGFIMNIIFNFLDLIGIPFRITIGKSIKDGKVELKKRCESDFTLVEIDNVIDEIKRLIQYN